MLVPCVVGLPAPRTADAPMPCLPCFDPPRTQSPGAGTQFPSPCLVRPPGSSHWMCSWLCGRGCLGHTQRASCAGPSRAVFRPSGLVPACAGTTRHTVFTSGAPRGVLRGTGGDSRCVPPGPRPLRVNFRVGASGALTKTLLEFGFELSQSCGCAWGPATPLRVQILSVA